MDKLLEIVKCLSENGRRKDVSLIVILLALEIYLFFKYFSEINSLDFYYLQWWLLPVSLLVTLFLWLIITVRLYIRDFWKLVDDISKKAVAFYQSCFAT